MAKKRVLIVEDELIISLLLKKMVSKLGYEVIDTVTSGEIAVDKAISTGPDIILMDIRLQGKMDGIEAISEIHKKIAAPVIYITGNSDEKSKNRAATTNFTDFLTKPVSSHQLSSSLSLAC